jgi:hypothetical protein
MHHIETITYIWIEGLGRCRWPGAILRRARLWSRIIFVLLRIRLWIREVKMMRLRPKQEKWVTSYWCGSGSVPDSGKLNDAAPAPAPQHWWPAPIPHILCHYHLLYDSVYFSQTGCKFRVNIVTWYSFISDLMGLVNKPAPHAITLILLLPAMH